jgi:hypothetical protein
LIILRGPSIACYSRKFVRKADATILPTPAGFGWAPALVAHHWPHQEIASDGALRVDFDRRLKLEFHGSPFGLS